MRSEALVGDAIVVTGELGGSILGNHLAFEPRVVESLLLRESVSIHAAVDVSDGLSTDLNRILEASGCGAELHRDSIPISSAARALAERSGVSPLEHALDDGEDFELVLTMSSADADRLLRSPPFSTPLTRIGTIVNGTGIWMLENDGSRRRVTPKGYVHTFD